MKESRRKNKVIIILLSVLYLLNSLDAIFTHYLVTNGLATELNPIMDRLIGMGGWVFITSKFLIMTVVVLFLWKLRNRLSVIKMAIYAKYHPKRLAHLPGTGQVSIPGREGPCVRDLGTTGSESPGVTMIQMGIGRENPELFAHG